MSIKRGIVLFLLAGAILYYVLTINAYPAFLQYSIPSGTAAPQSPAPDTDEPDDEASGDEKTPSALSVQLKSLKTTAEGWSGIIDSYAVTSDTTGVSMTGKNGQTGTAHLTGVYGSSSALPEKFLLSGRLFYPEELTGNESFILLDEQLSILLFRTGDSVGRSVYLDETQEFKVIGVLRHTREAGDADACGAYVPLLSLDEHGISSTITTVWASPIPGAGSATKFSSDMAAWEKGGTYISLPKEKYRAALSVRALLSIIGFLLVLNGFRYFASLVKHLYQDYQARLVHVFAVQLTWRMISYIALCVVCFAVLLAASYYLVQFALDAVYIFPEWIPSVPVEVSDIVDTFWKNVSNTSPLMEMRTPQLMGLRLYGTFTTLLCAAFGFVFLEWYGMLMYKRRRKQKPLPPPNEND